MRDDLVDVHHRGNAPSAVLDRRPIWMTSTPSLVKCAARRGSVSTNTVSMLLQSASATAPSSRLVGTKGKRGRSPSEKSELSMWDRCALAAATPVIPA